MVLVRISGSDGAVCVSYRWSSVFFVIGGGGGSGGGWSWGVGGMGVGVGGGRKYGWRGDMVIYVQCLQNVMVICIQFI